MHLNMKRSNLLLLLPFHRNHCFSILGGNSSNLPSWLPMYCNALVAVVKCILILVCIVARFDSIPSFLYVALAIYLQGMAGAIGRIVWYLSSFYCSAPEIDVHHTTVHRIAESRQSISHLLPLGYMYNTSRVQCVQMLTLKKGKGGTARLDYRRGSDRIESNQSLLLPVRPPDGSLSYIQAWCTLLVLV